MRLSSLMTVGGPFTIRSFSCTLRDVLSCPNVLVQAIWESTAPVHFGLASDQSEDSRGGHA